MMLEVWSNFFELVGGALTLNGEVLLAGRYVPRLPGGRDHGPGRRGLALARAVRRPVRQPGAPRALHPATAIAGALVYGARLLLWTVLPSGVVGVISPCYALPLPRSSWWSALARRLSCSDSSS